MTGEALKKGTIVERRKAWPAIKGPAPYTFERYDPTPSVDVWTQCFVCDADGKEHKVCTHSIQEVIEEGARKPVTVE